MSRTKYLVTMGGVAAWVKGKRWDVGGAEPVGASRELTAAQAARVKRLAERIGASVTSVPVRAHGIGGRADTRTSTVNRRSPADSSSRTITMTATLAGHRKGVPKKKSGKLSKAAFLRRMAAGRAKAARNRRY
jgi:hypothetical protein